MSTEGTKVLSKNESKTHPDWLIIGVKYVLYFFFFLCLLNQMKTTEMFFTPEKQTVNIFAPDISIIWQIPGIFFNWNAVPSYAVFGGWVIEALYWTALMKMKPMLRKAASIHPTHERLLLALLVAIIGVNLATDFMFGPSFFPGNDIVGHILYSILAEAVLIYGPIAISVLET